MFEDFEEEDVDVSPDSPDRAIVYAIWSKSESSSLTPEEGWAILHERYPDDPRFLLLNAYSELGAVAGSGSWTPGYFVTKLERITEQAPDTLHGPLKELLGFAGAVLAKATGDEASKVSAIRAKIGAEVDPATAGKRDDRAALKLRRFEREVLKELHDRTEGGKPLGTRAMSGTSVPPPAVNVLEQALGDPSRTRRKYSATEKFAKGELVEHSKFGVGVVTGLEPGRVAILFESGSRKLVAG
jgi:hypothetical protein